MILVFDTDKFPRTTTREQWRECWRWLRITDKILKKHMDEQMLNLAVFGSTMPLHVRAEIAEKIVNPPILYVSNVP